MKKLVCNLIIMGALAISSHSQAQHLLEALDAPSARDVEGVGPIRGGDPVDKQKEKCIAQGFLWYERVENPRPLIPEHEGGCFCPENEYIRGRAQWIPESDSPYRREGYWHCDPKLPERLPHEECNPALPGCIRIGN